MSQQLWILWERLLSNMVLTLHRNDGEYDFFKTCINFLSCIAWTVSSFYQTIIFFRAVSMHCRGSRISAYRHEIIQTVWPLTIRILLRLDFGLRPLTTKNRLMWNWSMDRLSYAVIKMQTVKRRKCWEY